MNISSYTDQNRIEREIVLDKHGYLVQFDQWDESVARQLAALSDIDLTDEHWRVIYELRNFYQQYNISPSMRPLIKYLQSRLSGETVSSLYLLKLFPGRPAALAAQIAGLPRPDNCF